MQNRPRNRSRRFLTYFLTLISLTSFFLASAQARDFKKIYIPGATCGNGSPYAVWLDLKNKDQMMVEFMGGGACWSAKTCYGPKLRAWAFPIPKVPVISWLSNDLGPKKTQGLLGNMSMLFFPYCTGDVFASDHSANYHPFKIEHRGYSNVIKTLAYLESEGLVNFASYKKFVLYGASAGAIGALVHAPNFLPYLDPTAEKILIPDSPGLHFGKTFWDKFPQQMFSDFQNSFSQLGIKITRQDHVIAKFIPQVCAQLHDFQIGILQAARDVIMSRVFGNISLKDHRALVYGEQGLYEKSYETNNCSVYTPDTLEHTFLLLPASSIPGKQEMSAVEFAQHVLNGGLQIRTKNE